MTEMVARNWPSATELRESSGGSLPQFTSLGCYMILYYTDQYDVLCSDCATEALDQDEKIIYDVYYEGPVETCENCQKPLESAYGDPNEEDTDDD